ncbi:MAG TPA: TonB family protein [Acidobacteriaceae bacterium]
MATEITTRGSGVARMNDQFGGGIASSFALHAAFAALLAGWAWFSHTGQNWGDSSSTAGAIQATMVNDIPLPPKQPMNPDNVLATETPSPAPVAPTPKTVEVPKPDAIPIPIKPAKPAKIADKTAPPPPLHPQPAKPELNKAPTGEATGVRMAMSSTETRAGTISVGTPDSGFGSRFAYYVQQITQKVAQQWYTGMLDPQASGHRVYITFQVERDGTPTNVQIAQRSGDATLDQTALNAVRHIDTFGPLPDAYTGNHINVTYYFDPPPHP